MVHVTQKRHRRIASGPAFTLVELLVVIGIIALLISMLMPALGRAREEARQTQCLSNMRQIGMALTMYANENDGFMTGQISDVWDFADPSVIETQPSFLGLLVKYLSGYKAIYACPDAIETAWVPAWSPTDISSTNYMVNAAVVGRKITDTRRSSETIILQEDKMLWRVCWMRPGLVSSNPRLYSMWHWNGDGFGEEYTTVHFKNHGGNLLFVDGHGEYRDFTTLHAGEFALTGGPGASGSASDDYRSQNFGTYFFD